MSLIPSTETNSCSLGRPDMSRLSPKDRFAVLCSWFLGPKAENKPILSEGFDKIVEEIVKGRERYFPDELVSLAAVLFISLHLYL
jgi:hypothetical protein